MITRREILRTAAAGAIATAAPSIAFANAETDARLVLVILRGAADGLAIAAPYGDGNYNKVRGDLALPSPDNSDGLLKLDGMFGLHPSLGGVHDEYTQGRALIVHAIASPYRDRSHFDGQDVLENGAKATGLLRDGWLNRALAPLGGSLGTETAIAMAQNTPLVLRGENSVTSWAPSQLPDADESTLLRLQNLYADDEFFAADEAGFERIRGKLCRDDRGIVGGLGLLVLAVGLAVGGGDRQRECEDEACGDELIHWSDGAVVW